MGIGRLVAPSRSGPMFNLRLRNPCVLRSLLSLSQPRQTSHYRPMDRYLERTNIAPRIYSRARFEPRSPANMPPDAINLGQGFMSE